MQTIALTDIIIPPNRQRRHFDEKKLKELEVSIASSKGLLHPIVLREDRKTLVAGERRLIAITNLHAAGTPFMHDGVQPSFGYIPYNILASLSEQELAEAELEENIIRVDLTWQEKAEATKRLHTLRQDQHVGEVRPGNVEGWTMKDTAEEIKGSDVNSTDIAKVRNSLIISEHLADPEVAKAGSEKEALKIIEKKLTRELRAEQAKRMGDKPSGSRHQLIHADMRELLRGMGSNTIDILITDPPYGVDAQSFGDQARTAHEYDDSFNNFVSLMEVLATESFRIAKEKAHAYIFCDYGNFNLISDCFELAGWEVWPRPIIWSKGNRGMLPRPNHGPRYSYETILYCIKGDRPTTAVYLDVIDIPNTDKADHAAAKPPELYVNLLQRSAFPGNVILDPFCGSGPIFPAADSLHLTAIGCELDEDAYNLALMHLKENPDEN